MAQIVQSWMKSQWMIISSVQQYVLNIYSYLAQNLPYLSNISKFSICR